jgi:hypothetical protein
MGIIIGVSPTYWHTELGRPEADSGSDVLAANCYDFFATAHGVPLVALSTDATSTDRSSIYIAPDIWALAREYREIDPDFYRGLDTEEIAGARVVQIEGQDVWEYLDGAADRAGVYQDKQQRLNSLFASPLVQYGGW